MRAYISAVYLFLYAPIALIVLFSFNSGRYAADLQGFSVAWYGRALANPFVVEALRTKKLARHPMLERLRADTDGAAEA